MVLVLILGLALLGLAVALAVRAVTRVGIETSERVEDIVAYGFPPAAGTGKPSIAGLRSSLDRIAGSIGTALAPRLRRFSEVEVTSDLLGAGIRDTAATTVLGYRVLAAIGLPIAVLLLGTAAGTSTGPLVFAVVFSAFAGWVAPMSVLRRRLERRRERIEAALPELIDLLVLMVEAGLGFSGSLRIAGGWFRGPLGDELRLTLQEQSMGLSTKQALTNLLERCETPAMRSFVRSILQGETLGVSIGAILRNLAVEMRKRRRAQVEQQAQKAPIKMLFPLVFMIFPALFVVILGPAVVSIFHALRAG